MSEPDASEVDALIDADVAAQLARQAELIERLTAQRDALRGEAATDPETDDGEDAQQEPVYDDVAAFVTGWLVPRSERLPAWCDSWWLHPLALTRLRALWESWEVANAEGGAAMSQWLKDDFDHHITTLTAKGGPFHDCQSDNTHRTGQMSVNPVPEETVIPAEPM